MLAAAAARPRAATLAPTLPHARSVEGQSACLWHRRSSDRASGRCSAPPSRAPRARCAAATVITGEREPWRVCESRTRCGERQRERTSCKKSVVQNPPKTTKIAVTASSALSTQKK